MSNDRRKKKINEAEKKIKRANENQDIIIRTVKTMCAKRQAKRKKEKQHDDKKINEDLNAKYQTNHMFYMIFCKPNTKILYRNQCHFTGAFYAQTLCADTNKLLNGNARRYNAKHFRVRAHTNNRVKNTKNRRQVNTRKKIQLKKYVCVCDILR